MLAVGFRRPRRRKSFQMFLAAATVGHASAFDWPLSGIGVRHGGLGNVGSIITSTPFAKAADPPAALIPRRLLRRKLPEQLRVRPASKKLIHEDKMLPTRVLDSGGSNSTHPTWKLQVNDRETHGSYLALSYCWGKPKPAARTEAVQLRKDNIRNVGICDQA
ncbi:hypothetical protein VUR80DRAFT_4308 [Thermomyces stellatus]